MAILGTTFLSKTFRSTCPEIQFRCIMTDMHNNLTSVRGTVLNKVSGLSWKSLFFFIVHSMMTSLLKNGQKDLLIFKIEYRIEL